MNTKQLIKHLKISDEEWKFLKKEYGFEPETKPKNRKGSKDEFWSSEKIHLIKEVIRIKKRIKKKPERDPARKYNRKSMTTSGLTEYLKISFKRLKEITKKYNLRHDAEGVNKEGYSYRLWYPKTIALIEYALVHNELPKDPKEILNFYFPEEILLDEKSAYDQKLAKKNKKISEYFRDPPTEEPILKFFLFLEDNLDLMSIPNYLNANNLKEISQTISISPRKARDLINNFEDYFDIDCTDNSYSSKGVVYKLTVNNNHLKLSSIIGKNLLEEPIKARNSSEIKFIFTVV